MVEYGLEKMSDAELAGWQSGWKTNTDKFILADREWTRRAMERQHHFNLQILEKQREMTKMTVLWTVAATIVGAILGAVLTTVF